MPLNDFHPAVSAWFSKAFTAPTPPQAQAWAAIQSGRHALIAAPTGSGKTLAAFLAAIDRLSRQGIAGTLADETQVVYVSPLKALSNDIQRNLEWPLAGIQEELQRLGLPAVALRALVRTGDTPMAVRAAMRKQPPHILVTTPESLYLLLTSDSGRAMLAPTRTVIVDEIHAVVGTKRGAHLALSLERLAALCPHPLQRIGLSATQKPIAEVGRFLLGARCSLTPSLSRRERETRFADAPMEDCALVDHGHTLARDLALELPGAPLEAVMSGEVWGQVYDRLAELIRDHHTTLVFVNTRRLAERVTRHLSERLGDDNVTAHHGSLAKEQRLDAEQRLKAGKLKALVATASLELGIDIGDVELVCQIGSPRRIATFLQRVGRANHAVGGEPKGRLFPLSRDELIECTALLDAVRRGELEYLRIPQKPLDVLAQQITAEVGCREWGEDELFDLVRRAYPYRELTRPEFDGVVRMLAEGFSLRRGRQAAYLHRDAVHKQLRGRRGSRLTALLCGGAIPDNADYQVVLEPSGIFIGTLNEDFAVESLAGDIFQLGNHSYRILRIESGRVRVEDAQNQPPSIPFWLGEAPARSDELSVAVSRLREHIEQELQTVDGDSLERATRLLVEDFALSRAAAEQIAEYLGAAKAVLGALPRQDLLIFERFFDESGGMQLVVHAPFGSRVNRALGLALRKRFCKQFNFELQAAATEDAVVLSLGETHSFPLEEVARYLHSHSVREVLVQALLDAPLFTTRWRWNANIALAVRRSRNGQRTPAPLQRMQAEDLLAVVFPDQLACAENLTGAREIPDHPLVNQTIYDCLHEAMDVEGLEKLLAALECGAKKIITRDLPQPSPLAQEILNARPYAYLDDAPLEERRTQAVMGRRWLDPVSAGDMGRLDPEAIALVRDEAWPQAESADELHDALLSLSFVAAAEGEHHGWRDYFEDLLAASRACRIAVNDRTLWVAAEQLPIWQALYPEAPRTPAITAPPEYAARPWTRDAALVEVIRGRLQGLGPVTAAQLAQSLNVAAGIIEPALLALESEGFALRGRFTQTSGDSADNEWCERRLLSRIHRYTVQRLRAEIEPVSTADFQRFLFAWQGIATEPRPQGPQALAAVVEQLEGFEAQAYAWEADILPLRVADYDATGLDRLCLAGRAAWARAAARGPERPGPVRIAPIALFTRRNLQLWRSLAAQKETPALSHAAQTVAQYLQTRGASFFEEILNGAGLLKSQVEAALGELAAVGLAHADSFSGLRTLLVPERKRAQRRRRSAWFGLEDAGRWALLPPTGEAPADAVETVARVLLRRYGVISRRVLTREAERLPSWYTLLRVYRRLEARGEIRGGRFVAGFTGEQYALPEAVGLLRAQRKQPPTAKFISISAADPLNLVGIVTPGARVPAIAGNRVLYQDGVPLAAAVGGEVRWLTAVDANSEWSVRNALLRGRPLPAAAAGSG